MERKKTTTTGSADCSGLANLPLSHVRPIPAAAAVPAVDEASQVEQEGAPSTAPVDVTSQARRPQIAIDPAICSGTPCLAGHRIPVGMIAEVVYEHGVDEAIEQLSLTRYEVLVACWYAGAFGTVLLWGDNGLGQFDRAAYRSDPVSSEWLTRWRAWSQASSIALWHSNPDKVTDPPTRTVLEAGTASQAHGTPEGEAL